MDQASLSSLLAAKIQEQKTSADSSEPFTIELKKEVKKNNPNDMERNSYSLIFSAPINQEVPIWQGQGALQYDDPSLLKGDKVMGMFSGYFAGEPAFTPQMHH